MELILELWGDEGLEPKLLEALRALRGEGSPTFGESLPKATKGLFIGVEGLLDPTSKLTDLLFPGRASGFLGTSSTTWSSGMAEVAGGIAVVVETILEEDEDARVVGVPECFIPNSAMDRCNRSTEAVVKLSSSPTKP